MKNAKQTPDYYANVPNVGAPGTPGKWRFPDKAPKDLAELIAKTTDGDVVADPKTKWADGEYVPLGDGSRVRWDGTKWLLLAPVLDHIEPTSHIEKSYFDLELRGANFVDKAKVKFGASDRDATCHSAEHLTVAVTKNDTAATYDIQVINPDGQQSGTKSLELKADDAPHISSIDPEEHVEGASFPLVVRGDSFNKDATIYAGSGVLNTGWKSATRLETTIPDDWSVGDHTITVKEAGEPTSNEKTLKIKAKPKPKPPMPTLSRISPRNAVENEHQDFTLYGSNFREGLLLKAKWSSGSGDYDWDLKSPSTATFGGTFNFDTTLWFHDPENDADTAKVSFSVHQKAKLPRPEITRLSPDSVEEGERRTISIAGNHIDGKGILRADGRDASGAITDRSPPVYFRLPNDWSHSSSPIDIAWENPDGQRSDPKKLYIRKKEEHHEPPHEDTAPHIDRITPATVNKDEQVSIWFVGRNLSENSEVQMKVPGASDFARLIALDSAGSGDFEITIIVREWGPHLLRIKNPNGELSNEVTLQCRELQQDIDTLTPVIIPPIMPKIGIAGKEFTMTVSGENFSGNCRVEIQNHLGAWKQFSQSRKSEKELQAYIHDDWGEGWMKVRVRNMNTERTSKEFDYRFVLDKNTPRIDSLSLNPSDHTPTTVTITGHNFHPGGSVFFRQHENSSVNGTIDHNHLTETNYPTMVKFAVWNWDQLQQYVSWQNSDEYGGKESNRVYFDIHH